MLVRRPAAPVANPNVLVLMHGLGSNAEDLMGLAPYLDPSLLVVSLQAPHGYPNGGYAWFDVTWEGEKVTVNGEQALASRELVMETLDALPEQLGITPGKLFIGGFSQGAMMSFGLVMKAASRFAGVLLLSGRILPEFAPSQEPLAGLPVLIQHGKHDQVLPWDNGRHLKDFLARHGAATTFKSYDMGHEINQASLDDLRAWLDQHL